MDERFVRTKVASSEKSDLEDDDSRRREYQDKKTKHEAELRFTEGDTYIEDEVERDNARRAGGEVYETYLAKIQTKRENYIKDFKLKTEDMNFLQKFSASVMRCLIGDGKCSLETADDRVLVWATYDGIVHFPASVRDIKRNLQSNKTQTDGGNKTKRQRQRKSVRHRRKSVRHRKKSVRHRKNL